MSISSAVEKVKDLKITLKPLKSVLDCNDEIVTVMIPNAPWPVLRGARILRKEPYEVPRLVGSFGSHSRS